MKIYLFRHGEKSTSFGNNPELSAYGQEQAQALLVKITQGKLPAPTKIFVSPKIRTQQSMQQVANALNLNLNITEALNEKTRDESHSDFQKRIVRFINEISKENGVIFACSHMDWVCEAMSLIDCDVDLTREVPSHWSPLQYVGLQCDQGHFEFIECNRITP